MDKMDQYSFCKKCKITFFLLLFKHEVLVTEYKVQTEDMSYKTTTKEHIEMYNVISQKGKRNSSYISYFSSFDLSLF